MYLYLLHILVQETWENGLDQLDLSEAPSLKRNDIFNADYFVKQDSNK